MSTRVSRLGRLLDAVGLLVFLVGTALFVRAWVGFRSVPDFQRSPGDLPTAAVQYADGFWRLQKIGVGVMMAGIALFVVAWFVARERPAE